MDKVNGTSSHTINTNKTSTTTNAYNINPITKHNRYGWICPICGRSVAPDQKYCGCRPQPAPIYPYYPVYPYWYKVTCDTPAANLSVSDYITTTSATIKTGDYTE